MFFVSRMWGLFYVNNVRQDAERSAYVSEYYAPVIWPDLWLENSRGVLQLQARNDVYFQAAVPTAWRLGSQILSALANSGETTFCFVFICRMRAEKIWSVPLECCLRILRRTPSVLKCRVF